MTRSVRARADSGWVLATVAVYAVVAGGAVAALAQPAGVVEPGLLDLYDAVKRFDFDERKLGNFEDEPMYWRRLSGEGLPAYSHGRFDEQVGHHAPPSFLFTLRGGNIAYEYAHADLNILPDSDYLIEVYVRAENLEYARALIACYLVDEAGQPIAGSEHVSEPVRSQADDASAEAWQRVQLSLRREFPGAHALRLQLWVLQTYVFQDPDEAAADPIVRQDVDARAWFDDVAVIRIPRVRLWLSNPGGIVRPGAQESVHVDAHNAMLKPLHAALTICDDAGLEHLRADFDLLPRTSEEFQVPLPDLPAGMYNVDVQLSAAGETIMWRSTRLAVLPQLFADRVPYPELGIDLGCWPDSDPTGAVELITVLGCGAVKIGLPMNGNPEEDLGARYLRQARDLARQLAAGQIETTGVILPPTSSEAPQGRGSTLETVISDPAWEERAGPVFAYLGGQLTSWQLGEEERELRVPGGWDADAIGEVRRKLKRFVAVPQLVVPRSVFDAPPASPLPDYPVPDVAASGAAGERSIGLPGLADQPHAYAFWLPADLPARSFPWQLAFWSDEQSDRQLDGMGAGVGRRARGPSAWLSVGLPEADQGGAGTRLADMARRIVLALAVNPDRLYVRAPFELSTAGGAATWQPTSYYIPLRTLLHHLSGKRALASMTVGNDAAAILFGQAEQQTLVLWTWQPASDEASVALYLGTGARAYELSGAVRDLEFDGPLVHVPLSPVPLIIENVDTALLLLQDSFRVEPAVIQLHDPEPRPTLTLRNHYLTPLVGTLELHPPPTWEVSPSPVHVELGPGEEFSQELHFTIPPRQIASQQVLGVDLHLRRPDVVDLHFDVPLQIKLRDIIVQGSAWWDGNELVVEQSLYNMSSQPVSFNGFCQPVNRAQVERVFLNVPPGDVRTQEYRLPAARDLAGTRLWMGIREIGGRRTLDQLVAVPR